jgi:hypothetical protein
LSKQFVSFLKAHRNKWGQMRCGQMAHDFILNFHSKAWSECLARLHVDNAIAYAAGGARAGVGRCGLGAEKPPRAYISA